MNDLGLIQLRHGRVFKKTRILLYDFISGSNRYGKSSILTSKFFNSLHRFQCPSLLIPRF